MTKTEAEFCRRLAHGIAQEFGPHCEVAVHDLETGDPAHSIIAIENGYITARPISYWKPCRTQMRRRKTGWDT